MNLSELPWRPTRRVLRQFAAAWLVVFLLLAAHQTWVRQQPGWGGLLAGLALLVGGLGWVLPPAIRWLFVAAMVLTFPIGWLISQATLALMYFGIITPVALFFRLTKRDALGRTRVPAGQTYWKDKPNVADVRRYFRQF